MAAREGEVSGVEGHNIGSEVRRLIANAEATNPDAVEAARIHAAWRVCMEPAVLKHTTGLFVVPGTGAGEVVVYVDSSLWTQELSLQGELLRLKLNLELQRGRPLPERDEGGQEGLFELAHAPEQVRSLRFEVSKERYRPQEHVTSTAEQLREQTRGWEVEPIALSAEELAQIACSVSGIADDELRERAFAAARANLELQKGIEASASGGTGGAPAS